MQRRCPKCGEVKTSSEFYRKLCTKSGLSHYCKTCTILMARNYRERNRDKIKEYQRQWYLKNREKMMEYARRWRQNNRERFRTFTNKARQNHRRKHPDRAHAQSIVTCALQGGYITKQPCRWLNCNSITKIEAHHPDYSKPREIVWLCQKHHRELHTYSGKTGFELQIDSIPESKTDGVKSMIEKQFNGAPPKLDWNPFKLVQSNLLAHFQKIWPRSVRCLDFYRRYFKADGMSADPACNALRSNLETLVKKGLLKRTGKCYRYCKVKK